MGRLHHLPHRALVEHVELDRLGTEGSDPLVVPGRPEGPDDLVPAGDELRNEPGTNGAARPSDEDSHDVLPRGTGDWPRQRGPKARPGRTGFRDYSGRPLVMKGVSVAG